MIGRYIRLLLYILLLTLCSTPLWAKEKTTVAVLPFSVHSAENIDYVQQGILDMLSSRISADERITVIGKEKVLEALKGLKAKDLSVEDVYGLGKQLNADYVVSGSLTKIGNSVSLDGKFVDITTGKTPVSIFTQSPGMDDVISKISDFAQKINQFVMGTLPGAMPAPVGAAPVLTPPIPQAPEGGGKEKQIIAGIKSGRKPTMTGSVNPDFLTGAQPLDKKNFWMSQKYPTEFKGMDIGDVNGDGLNEIVAIDNNNVYIFQKRGNEMFLLQKISGRGYEKYVGVDLFSLTGSSSKDILVSNLFASSSPTEAKNSVQSFILTWKGDKFVKTADKLPWFFRVVGPPGERRLLGQKLSASADSPTAMSRPFQTPIHEMVWRDGSIAEGRKMKIPSGLFIYGLTLDNLGEGRDKIIALNRYDHLYVIEETEKDLSKMESFIGGKEILYRSDDVFGGGNTAINLYGEDEPGDVAASFNIYLNPRILTYDTQKDGRREVFIVKNDSPSGRLLKNVKIFTTSEMYNLRWDTLGLSENWRTKKMSGYAADYQIGDVDNDGEDEIVLALVASSGSLVGRSSVIVSYKLRAQ